MQAESGFAGLYVGLPATLMIAVPNNVLYFAAYEAMSQTKKRLNDLDKMDLVSPAGPYSNPRQTTWSRSGRQACTAGLKSVQIELGP